MFKNMIKSGCVKLALLLAVLLTTVNSQQTGGFLSEPSTHNPAQKIPSSYENLTYYVIPHSHTDAGWWLTYENYYQGRAKRILSTLYEYLKLVHLSNQTASNQTEESKKERFLWADYAFFIKWWKQDTTKEIRDDMKELVKRGIFSIEHGGMVQHDEALSDYKSITVMFDTSLQFIKENFGILPKVGMSIDGFGHSSLTPYLFRALGHEALIMMRMPVELYDGFNQTHQYFFTWEGDAGERIKVYRLVFYSLDERFNVDRATQQYGTCFTQEDMCAETFLELHLNYQMFNALAQDSALSTATTDHQRVAYQTFGTDFAYQDARSSFKNVHSILNNLDRYLQKKLQWEFSTFTGLHQKFHGHADFDKILPGDLLVYDEKNKDSWSGYYGSKPDLKLHIKRIFNSYRATETLFFVVRAELERLKTAPQSSDKLQQNFVKKTETLKTALEEQQALLEGVRIKIAILLHHDAITGTNAPAAESDWMDTIFNADQVLTQMQYQLVDKLGRLQATSTKVDVAQISVSRKGVFGYDALGRGAFQVSVFNPLPVQRGDLVRLKVYSNNVTVVRIPPLNSSYLQSDFYFTVVKTFTSTTPNTPSEYEILISSHHYPLGIASYMVYEGPSNQALEQNIAKEQLLLHNSVHEISLGGLTLTLVMNMGTNMTRSFQLATSDGSFQTESITENLVFYSGTTTHSCMYLFNPPDDKVSIENYYKLVNVTTLETHAFKQIRFNYEKVYNGQVMSYFSKIYTLYQPSERYMRGLASVLNITYIMQNHDSKEYMIQLKRSADNFRVFTDDSAFLNERKYNASFGVGSNTFPYVNGIVWEPIRDDTGNTLTIATNRAGGVSLKSPELDTLDFFITRKIDNVNIDKGLPNRLDDAVESRHEFILNFDKFRGNAASTQKRMSDLVNQHTNFLQINCSSIIDIQ